MVEESPQAPPCEVDYFRRHMRFGWWSLLLFLALGGVLEALHGLKVGWYLDVGNQMRRLMWTLAHAHGTLLGLVHIAFAVTTRMDGTYRHGLRRLASLGLIASSVLLPGGFFVGGVVIHSGDPGLGILLVPPAAVVMLSAVLAVAWDVTAKRRR